jgi:hypothetical protein
MKLSKQLTLRERPALILGNGPSAKLVEFELFRDGGIATIGMNAAYRHWDLIDFRPTHYICMDTVLIRSHAGRIAELIREGRVEQYFLRNEFLELYPEFYCHPRILWFDDVRSVAGSIFDTDWITTGSWAIRWAAFEGCRLAALIGVDVNYVEMLPEALRLGDDQDLRLELTGTPRFNPNYFFSEYQQSGDRYNIPNDPAYTKQTGGLVHVDALREAANDVSRLEYAIRVFDSSPISSHGIFPKCDIDRLFSGRRIALVTSFFAAAPADEVANNVSIALANSANPDIFCVRVLFEGERKELDEKIGRDLGERLAEREREGRIEILRIESRPDYLFLFRSAQSMGQELCAVTNSDILLSRDFTAGLLEEYLGTRRPFLAITRWNRTANGLFIQGNVANPPWQEIEVENLDAKQRNVLSFDLYFFDWRSPLPQHLGDVQIGTLGCDTAVASLMRVAGQCVINPCLTYRPVHIDEKLRNYSTENGMAQLMANCNIVTRALKSLVQHRASLSNSLDKLEQLRPSIVSIGYPLHRLGPWYCLNRILGSVPWVTGLSTQPLIFEKLSFSVEDTQDRPEALIVLLTAALDAGHFLELEIKGLNGNNYVECLRGDPRLQLLWDRLRVYDFQSVVFVDVATPEERQIHADVSLLLRHIYQMASVPLDQTFGGSSIATPLRESFKAAASFAGGLERREIQKISGSDPNSIPLQPFPPNLMILEGETRVKVLAISSDSKNWTVRLQFTPSQPGEKLACLMHLMTGDVPKEREILVWSGPSIQTTLRTAKTVTEQCWLMVLSNTPESEIEFTISYPNDHKNWPVQDIAVALLPAPSQNSPVNFKEANRWSREKKSEALAAYLALFADTPLSIYACAAMTCARAANYRNMRNV